MSALLEARGLTKQYGGLTAVSAVDFDVRAGEILGVIGPNGAGKSTTFGMIAGAIAPTSGSVTPRRAHRHRPPPACGGRARHHADVPAQQARFPA